MLNQICEKCRFSDFSDKEQSIMVGKIIITQSGSNNMICRKERINVLTLDYETKKMQCSSFEPK